jgi:hypothetical protein
MRTLFLAAASFAFSAHSALSQPAPAVCQHTPAILAAADLALKVPAEKPRFWRDLHGSDAAYLKIRYGWLDFAATSAFLDELDARERKPERLAELRMSHARTQGRLAMIAMLDPTQTQGSPLLQLRESVLRALVVEDGGGWLVSEMQRWLDSNPGARMLASGLAQSVGGVIADADDATKAALAARAEAAGLWQLAFFVDAYRDDLGPLVALIDRAPPGAFFEGPLSADQRLGLLRQALPRAELSEGFDIAKQPPEIKAIDATSPVRAQMRNLYRLASRFRDASLLATVINQTGEIRLASELAPALLKDITERRLDPAKAADASFVAMIAGIDGILGVERRQAALAGFDFVNSSGLGSNAGDYTDHIVARWLLAPVVNGGEFAGERPAQLSRKYDWDRALVTARQLGAKQTIADADRLLAAELLAGAGRFEEAIELLGLLTDEKTRPSAAHALAIMLDQACADVLKPPLPLFPSLYRFAPRG